MSPPRTRLDSRSEAREFSKAVAFIQSVCSKATDDSIQNAIRTMAPHSTLRSLLWRYLIRADRFPPQPFAHGADDEIKPLDSAQSLIMAGYRFRNCLRRHLGGVLTGAIAFAEFRDLILEFKPLSGEGWILTDVHSHRNGLVAYDDERAGRDKCASLGVPHIIRSVNSDGWDAVARITGRWDWMTW